VLAVWGLDSPTPRKGAASLCVGPYALECCEVPLNAISDVFLPHERNVALHNPVADNFVVLMLRECRHILSPAPSSFSYVDLLYVDLLPRPRQPSAKIPR